MGRGIGQIVALALAEAGGAVALVKLTENLDSVLARGNEVRARDPYVLRPSRLDDDESLSQ